MPENYSPPTLIPKPINFHFPNPTPCSPYYFCLNCCSAISIPKASIHAAWSPWLQWVILYKPQSSPNYFCCSIIENPGGPQDRWYLLLHIHLSNRHDMLWIRIRILSFDPKIRINFANFSSIFEYWNAYNMPIIQLARVGSGSGPPGLNHSGSTTMQHASHPPSSFSWYTQILIIWGSF
jgi:hypothetical protein